MPPERSSKAPDFGGSHWIFYPARQTRSQTRESGGRKTYAADDDSGSDDRDFMIARPLKQREICSPEQKLALEQLYEQTNGYPTTAQRLALCAQIGKSPESTYTWFQNKRNSAKEKKRRMLSGGGGRPAKAARAGSEEATTPGPATPASQETTISSNESIGTSHADSMDGHADTALGTFSFHASPANSIGGLSSTNTNSILNLDELELRAAKVLADMLYQRRQSQQSHPPAAVGSHPGPVGSPMIANPPPEVTATPNTNEIDDPADNVHQAGSSAPPSLHLSLVDDSECGHPRTNVASEPRVFSTYGYVWTASELHAVRVLCESHRIPVTL
ncbi:hypothetical protein FRC17_006542 [Serendipita sp. 399]|nr:hypothetical protein FRC17_006542 [Serendipita sp. 399]